jgi:hypothetical protein
MFLYQEVIRVRVSRCPESQTDMKTADLTPVGSIYIAWKECVKREGEKEAGQSPWLSFEEELRDRDSECTVDVDGMFIGQL